MDKERLKILIKTYEYLIEECEERVTEYANSFDYSKGYNDGYMKACKFILENLEGLLK